MRTIFSAAFLSVLGVLLAGVALSHNTRPAFGDTASAIAAGGNHTCALTGAGAVKCWGRNVDGQLGDNTDIDRYKPIGVFGLSSGVAAIAAGYYDTCALTATSAVKCWGDNYNGQVGDGTTTDRYKPTGVFGLSSGVAAIDAGDSYTCALTATGGVKCWGWNGHGGLGDGTTDDRHKPTDVSGLSTGVSAIATGYSHTCVLTTAGGVRCWGNNEYGRIGDGTTTDRFTPIDVSGLTSSVVAISAGGAHTCALTTAGGIKCWGYNYTGQVGDGTTDDRYTPADVPGLSSGVAAIAAGYSHTCALTTAGGVKCWGNNAHGVLGDGTTDDRHTPTDVPGLSSGVAAISAGEYHTCALTDAGGVKCWGYNWAGQVGDDTTDDRLTPTGVVGLSDALAPSPTPVPTATPVATPANGLIGDVDCDGDTDSVDALFVLRDIVQLPHSAQCIAEGDVDCDDSLDAVDALFILRHVVFLPVPKWGCGGSNP